MASPIYDEEDSATQVFVCPLCCDLVMEEPTITHCQHIFCRKCIHMALDRQNECPIDRRSLRKNQLMPLHGPLKQIWQATKVRCPKCVSWTGTVENYGAHFAECKYLDQEQIKELQKALEESKEKNKSLKILNESLRRKLETTTRKLKSLQKNSKEAQVTERLVKLSVSPIFPPSPFALPNRQTPTSRAAPPPAPANPPATLMELRRHPAPTSFASPNRQTSTSRAAPLPPSNPPSTLMALRRPSPAPQPRRIVRARRPITGN